jgi:hypothetical protein
MPAGGAPLDTTTSAVFAVVPGKVVIRARTVARAGMRALNADVKSTLQDRVRSRPARVPSLARELPAA